jgi:hypothetical protein
MRTAEAEAGPGRVRERVVEGIERACTRDVDAQFRGTAAAWSGHGISTSSTGTAVVRSATK